MELPPIYHQFSADIEPLVVVCCLLLPCSATSSHLVVAFTLG